MKTNTAHLEPAKEKADEPLPHTHCSPSFLCRMIGHNWKRKTVDEKKYPGYRITEVFETSHCRRCGVANPGHIHSENADVEARR